MISLRDNKLLKKHCLNKDAGTELLKWIIMLSFFLSSDANEMAWLMVANEDDC